MLTTTHRCRKCGQTLLASDFNKCSATSSGLQAYCRQCMKVSLAASREKHKDRPKPSQSARQRDYRRRNPEKYKASYRKQNEDRKRDPDKYRDWRLRYRYGIGLDGYNKMHAAQSGACDICRMSDVRRLVVDHDHATGAVRSLLCDECNSGLGKFKDSPDLLAAAAAYLERHREYESQAT